MARRRRFGSVCRDGKRRGWYVRFTACGKRIKRAGGPTKEEAEKRLLQVEALLRSGVALSAVLGAVFDDFDGRKLRFKEAKEPYLAFASKRKKDTTLARDRERLDRICRADWAGKHLCKITTAEIGAWIQTETTKKDGVSEATANRLLSTVSTVFKWAKTAGYVSGNPVADVPRYSEAGRARKLYATAAECEALIAAAAPVFQPYLMTAVHTGARAGELAALTWSDVYLDEGRIWLRDTKTREPRAVPFTPQLRKLFARLRRSVPALDGRDPVFTVDGRRPIQPHERRRLFRDARSRATALRSVVRKELRFHDLRHSAASVMISAGVPLEVVGQVLGHKTTQTTRRYAHLLPEAGEAAVARLGAAFEAAGRKRQRGAT